MKKFLLINLFLVTCINCAFSKGHFLYKVGIDTMSREEYVKSLDKYRNGERRPDFLRHLAETASLFQDDENAQRIGSDYIRLLKVPYSKEDFLFIERYTNHSTDPGFKLFLDYSQSVDSVLGANSAINKVKSIIYQEEIKPHLQAGIDWDRIQKKVVEKYGAPGEEIFLRAKMLNYFNKRNMSEFIESAVPYVQKYGERVPLFELNNYAWEIFQQVSDTNTLLIALAWSKITLKEKETITFLDTYANLLYKLGRKEEAISTEEKALNLASKNERLEFQLNLEKMKKGENTWK